MDQAVLNELLTICWRIARNVTTITVADLEKLREVLEKIASAPVWVAAKLIHQFNFFIKKNLILGFIKTFNFFFPLNILFSFKPALGAEIG